MGAAAGHAGSGRFGADLTQKQFLVLVAAICLGTMIEWHDFFAYSQLSSYLTRLFFPAGDPALQQISFWLVFFVGFLARPVGSLVFGSVADTAGRRPALLLTICGMAVPTVLIGCLPTYSQAGVAAPVLLALLRLVQGLAMGGEFGTSLVYLGEVAPPRAKGMVGSIGFAASISGCISGVLSVLIVEAALTPAQMELFGWRIPFLLSLFSAAVAFVLRLHYFPEPHCFLEDRHRVLEERRREAAQRQEEQLALSAPPDDAPRKGSSILSSLRLSSAAPSPPSLGGASAAAAARACSKAGAAAAPGGWAGGDVEQGGGRAADASVSVEAGGGGSGGGGSGGGASAGSAAPPPGAAARVGYAPAWMLLRHRAPMVLLQCAFEAWPSVAFYVASAWVPLQLTSALGVPFATAQGLLVVNLAVVMAAMVCAGAAVDRGLPRVRSCFCVYTAAAALCAPALLGMQRFGGSLAAVWLLHALLMAMVGLALGVVPTACSQLYHPAVLRSCGFNLGHNLAMSWLGGLSPTIVTALASATGQTFLAPGILLTATAGVSMAASLVMLRVAPAADRDLLGPSQAPAAEAGAGAGAGKAQGAAPSGAGQAAEEAA